MKEMPRIVVQGVARRTAALEVANSRRSKWAMQSLLLSVVVASAGPSCAPQLVRPGLPVLILHAPRQRHAPLVQPTLPVQSSRPCRVGSRWRSGPSARMPLPRRSAN